MTELIIGIAIGAAGMYAKDKVFGNSTARELEEKRRELDNLYTENEKYHKRNKDLSRQVEDLQIENDKLKRQVKDNNNDYNDIQDELDEAKNEIKRLHMQNDELCQKMQEYKSACESYEFEINHLKGK